MRLKQILVNLVKNALTFARGGLVRLLTAYNSDKNLLIVYVVDDGVGISEDEIS